MARDYSAGGGVVVTTKTNWWDSLINWKGYDYTKRGTSYDATTTKKAEIIAEEKKIERQNTINQIGKFGTIATVGVLLIILNLFRR